jgi:hypothetical protein
MFLFVPHPGQIFLFDRDGLIRPPYCGRIGRRD